MNNQNQPQQAGKPENPIAILQTKLQQAPDITSMLSLPEIEKAFVANYELLSNKKDGAAHYALEKVLFAKAVSTYSFKNVERISLHAAFADLALSGLTLRDGISYIVPFGKQAVFMPGWKGRLEQITDMPNVIFVHEPQVVRKDDVFEFELGMVPKIIKHIPTPGSTAPLTYVYLVIEFTQGVKVFMMTAAECYNIRDRFSQSYKTYLAECRRANMEIGSTFTKPGAGYDITVEPPMWISDEIQAFKKTLIKRTYQALPKLKKHKDIDKRIESMVPAGVEIDGDEAANSGADYMQNAEVLSSGPIENQGGYMGDNENSY